MSVQEAWNRGNNLVATAVLAISGFAFFPEFFIEDEWQHKIDEGLLFLLGIAAIGWYLSKNHKFTRSITPVLMVWAGFVIKIMALVIEHKDAADVGDDFGAIILFLLASILVTVLYTKSKKLLKS